MSSEVAPASGAPHPDGRRARVGAFLVAWLLTGVVFAGQVFLWSALMGTHRGWWECVVVTLPDLAIWAGVIPLIATLARRVPPGRRSWSRTLAFHLPLALALAAAAVGAHVALAAALGWVSGPAVTELLRLRLSVHLPTGVAVYAALVAGLRALPGTMAPAASPPESAVKAGDTGSSPGAVGLAPAGRPARRVAVPIEDGTRLLAADEIDWVEADRNYSVIHAGDDSERVRESLGSLEKRLGLLRIHKSTLVNLDRVERVHRWRHGDFLVELRDGTRLRLSRSYRESFEERLGTRV